MPSFVLLAMCEQIKEVVNSMTYIAHTISSAEELNNLFRAKPHDSDTPLTIIAMSGGVDSSVTCARAAHEHHNCIGLTLKMREEPHQVPAQEALMRAQKTCEQFDIPHITYDVSHIFQREIIEHFAQQYAAGKTPNPCIVCNPTIKFGKLVEVAQALGASRIVTGHYANIVLDSTGTKRLKRAQNISKDQTYFMYRVHPDLLNLVDLPLGEVISKDEVRKEAADQELLASTAADSMDVCFLEHESRLDLINRIAPSALASGEIIDMNGMVIGQHKGIAHVTIGQRKGLDYAGGKRLYVREIDAQKNRVQIAEMHDLYVDRITIDSVVLHTALDTATHYDVQVRYRSAPVKARISAQNDTPSSPLIISFDAPVMAVAPGQSAVIYDDDGLVVGGGFISDVHFIDQP